MSEEVQYGVPAGDEEAELYMRTFSANIAANYAAYAMSLADSAALVRGVLDGSS